MSRRLGAPGPTVLPVTTPSAEALWEVGSPLFPQTHFSLLSPPHGGHVATATYLRAWADVLSSREE